MSVGAVAVGWRRRRQTHEHLEYELEREHAREHKVELLEVAVALAVRVDRVLGGERDGARTDHYHDGRIEVGQRHQEVAQAPDPVHSSHIRHMCSFEPRPKLSSYILSLRPCVQ